MPRSSAARLRLWSLLPILLSVNGCLTVSGVNEPCAGFRPILTHQDDRMTRETETAIIVHNETWLALGCRGAP